MFYFNDMRIPDTEYLGAAEAILSGIMSVDYVEIYSASILDYNVTYIFEKNRPRKYVYPDFYFLDSQNKFAFIHNL